MQITYSWLKDYVALTADPQRVADVLTDAGVAVETVTALNPGLVGAVTGRLLDVSPHPQADKLLVCSVDVGNKVLQIVSGADNVRTGQIVPVAVPGTRLPDGRTIEAADFRGVSSQGMLLSPDEMGIDRKVVPLDMRDGILILPDGTELGLDVIQALGLSDQVLEFDLTPNRADCLSVMGVALDVSALLGAEILEPPLADLTEAAVESCHGLSVEIADRMLCPAYLALVVDNVRVAESPLWLQNRLRNVGLRPVNNIVDLTNYVMWELGQPMHAFDHAALEGQRIVVRPSQAQEEIVTLDGIKRRLPEGVLLIADEKRAVGIAGVMGGLDSEVTQNTSKIVIESAWFDQKSIRRTARTLGLRSEASARFDKGIDPAGVYRALRRIAFLLECMGIGRVLTPLVGANAEYERERTIMLRPERVNSLLGLNLSPAMMIEITERLGFVAAPSGARLAVSVPSRRRDVNEEVDLIEEIGRVHGMDNIPTLEMEGRLTQGGLTETQRTRRRVRADLLGMGLSEVMTLSFYDQRSADALLLPPGHPWRRAIPIENPLSSERGWLRPSLLTGIVGVLTHNQARQVPGMSCFELGSVFSSDSLPLNRQPDETPMLGLGCYGSSELTWRRDPDERDFFYLKGVVEALNPELMFRPSEHGYLHPGRQADIYLDTRRVGYIGQLHPLVEENMGLRISAQVAELCFDSVFESAPTSVRYSGVPRFLPSYRDMAFVVAASVPADSVMAAIKSAGSDLLRSVRLFDIYSGDRLAPGMRSLAFRLEFVNLESTMTEELISRAMAQIALRLESELGARLRS